MDGKRAVRLTRLAAAARRSKHALEDDVSALHTAILDADQAGDSVREVAECVGMSPSHTHRIMSGQVGAGAVL